MQPLLSGVLEGPASYGQIRDSVQRSRLRCLHLAGYDPELCVPFRAADLTNPPADQK